MRGRLRDLDSTQEPVQNGQVSRCLQRKIAARFLHDEGIRVALMPCVGEQLQQSPHGTVGLGGGKENIRVEKDPHPQRSAGALRLPAGQDLLELGLLLVELADALLRVDLEGERDRRP